MCQEMHWVLMKHCLKILEVLDSSGVWNGESETLPKSLPASNTVNTCAFGDPGGHDWAQPGSQPLMRWSPKWDTVNSHLLVFSWTTVAGRHLSYWIDQVLTVLTLRCVITLSPVVSLVGGGGVGGGRVMWLSSHSYLRDLTVSHNAWNRVL